MKLILTLPEDRTPMIDHADYFHAQVGERGDMTLDKSHRGQHIYRAVFAPGEWVSAQVFLQENG